MCKGSGGGVVYWVFKGSGGDAVYWVCKGSGGGVVYFFVVFRIECFFSHGLTAYSDTSYRAQKKFLWLC